MITIKRESFTKSWQEGVAMMKAHHAEAGEVPGDFDLNIPLYAQGDTKGNLILVVARDDGVPVGYSTCWHGLHPHVKTSRVAQGDTIYVHPAYRGKWIGYKILKHMLTELRPSGPMLVRYNSKVKRDTSAILKRLGFQADEVSYTLKL